MECSDCIEMLKLKKLMQRLASGPHGFYKSHLTFLYGERIPQTKKTLFKELHYFCEVVRSHRLLQTSLYLPLITAVITPRVFGDQTNLLKYQLRTTVKAADLRCLCQQFLITAPCCCSENKSKNRSCLFIKG
ncbi:hypothetical protein AMECASPLE_039642 [Ameca splendens]|uniref:Uncharacterized protein n=1 Tax=Ameca splendens TaxID=208324 RepID=A0ABV0ZHA2_9TELE